MQLQEALETLNTIPGLGYITELARHRPYSTIDLEY